MIFSILLHLIFVLLIITFIILAVVQFKNGYQCEEAIRKADYDNYRMAEEEKKEYLEKYKKSLSKAKKLLTTFSILIGLSIVGEIFIPGNIHQVNTGEVAVVRTMGKVSGIREAGIYWDLYMINSYEKYDTKVREINIETQTYSKDNQIIGVTADLQYTIDSVQADNIATEYGTIEK